jgi:hypothetical protein
MPKSKKETGSDGPLAGMVFAFSGKFSTTQPVLKGMVEAQGGAVSSTVTQKVTHLVTMESALTSDKRAAAVATAIGRKLPLVSEDFILQTAESGAALDIAAFLLHCGGADADASAKDVAQGLADDLERKKERIIARQAARRSLLEALGAWACRAEAVAAARTALQQATARMRLDAGFEALLYGVEKRRGAVQAVTDAMAGVSLGKKTAEELAADSLRPAGDSRVRLLVDTNVYLNEPVETWAVLEVAPAPRPPKRRFHPPPGSGGGALAPRAAPPPLVLIGHAASPTPY